MSKQFDTSGLRVLNSHELSAVAGGDGEGSGSGDIIVTGRLYNSNNVSLSDSSGSWHMSFKQTAFHTVESFFNSVFNEEYVVTQDVPAPTSAEGDIIVQASAEQVAAAKQAYEDAGVRLSTVQVLAAIGGALVNRYAGAAVAGANEVADINRESLQNSYADMLYYQDGADGSYDGYRAGDYGAEPILMPF